MLNSYSTYDILSIGEKLEDKNGDFSISEIFIFSYLACLISIYDGKPLSFWGYHFIKNNLGVPLSEAISCSVDTLKSSEDLIEDKGYYKLSLKGKNNLDLFKILNSFKNRDIYINASCDCLLAIPLGFLRESLKNDPISLSAKSNDIKMLNDDSNYAIDILYEQFSLLNQALNKKHDDLFIPAVTWLRYLQLCNQVSNDR